MSKTKYALQAEGKNTVIAYVLWWFLGAIGVHRMYLGRTGSGVAMLSLFIIGIVTAVLAVGYIFLSIVGIWWLVDGFLTYSMVKEENTKRGLLSSAIIVTSEENPPNIS